MSQVLDILQIVKSSDQCFLPYISQMEDIEYSYICGKITRLERQQQLIYIRDVDIWQQLGYWNYPGYFHFYVICNLIINCQ